MTHIRALLPWQYEVSAGFTVRGYYTEPTGKPVLHFIHGNGFCGLSYEVLLGGLQDEVDLFISDAQGHGNSDEGGVYPGWNRSARYFEEVWMHFSQMWKGVPHIACGHSYGAVMSTLMMARNPALFDFGLLLDPTFSPPGLAAAMSAMSTLGLMKRTSLAKQAKVRSISWPDRQTTWDYFHQRGVFRGWQDECLESYLEHALLRREDGSFHLKCPPRIEAAIFSSYVRKLWPAIKAIRQPMTMFYGAQTMPFILESRAKIRRSNAHFDFIEMPGGHCFMQQQPELCADEIKRKIRLTLKQRTSAALPV